MKLTEIGDQVMDGMTKDAGAGEMAAINSLLRKLPDADRLDLDEAIGGLVVALLEAGFMAGLKASANPLALLVDGANA